MIATTLGAFETASAVASTRGRVTASSQPKIDTALSLMERYVDFSELLGQRALPIPTVTTPEMFTYQLLERARSDRKRIVLPEGDDDRILEAAGRLLRRDVVELTILGDEGKIFSRAAELGADLSPPGPNSAASAGPEPQPPLKLRQMRSHHRVPPRHRVHQIRHSTTVTPETSQNDVI